MPGSSHKQITALCNSITFASQDDAKNHSDITALHINNHFLITGPPHSAFRALECFTGSLVLLKVDWQYRLVMTER
jgi:hypothetical protein